MKKIVLTHLLPSFLTAVLILGSTSLAGAGTGGFNGSGGTDGDDVVETYTPGDVAFLLHYNAPAVLSLILNQLEALHIRGWTWQLPPTEKVQKLLPILFPAAGQRSIFDALDEVILGKNEMPFAVISHVDKRGCVDLASGKLRNTAKTGPCACWDEAGAEKVATYTYREERSRSDSVDRNRICVSADLALKVNKNPHMMTRYLTGILAHELTHAHTGRIDPEFEIALIEFEKFVKSTINITDPFLATQAVGGIRRYLSQLLNARAYARYALKTPGLIEPYHVRMLKLSLGEDLKSYVLLSHETAGMMIRPHEKEKLEKIQGMVATLDEKQIAANPNSQELIARLEEIERGLSYFEERQLQLNRLHERSQRFIPAGTFNRFK